MHHARLVNSPTGRLLNVASETGVRDAPFPRLEFTDNAAGHEDTACWVSVIHHIQRGLPVARAQLQEKRPCLFDLLIRTANGCGS
jgi:hypothetical protein